MITPSTAHPTSGPFVPHFLLQPLQAGFKRLLRPYFYAEHSCGTLWEFAVEYEELRCAGFGNNDLRWLIANGYVEHAEETGDPNNERRVVGASANPCLSGKSRFMLTAEGVELACSMWQSVDAASFQDVAGLLASQYACRSADGYESQSSCDDSHANATLPRWNAARRELYVGETLVKRFRVPAANQETILQVFEEEAWPDHIDDPLPPAPEMVPKQRLQRTVTCLNRNQRQRRIRFRGDGTGAGICWELV